ncbi:unnamed protein product [Prorocentrum cordatum]|uniref:Uncharacterized protein n=1 Tax=Prorocentrum cordatum TaxID=2364126 RepID=A0ABN9PMN9_9DINO|nr:unnamed protein product [Polarella glacialis]
MGVKGKSGQFLPPNAWAAAAAILAEGGLDPGAAGEARKLKPQGSNPEGPDKKIAKVGFVDSGVSTNVQDMDMKDMMKVMMKDMQGMREIMRSSAEDVREAVAEARSAKEAANQPKAAVSTVEKDVQKLKETVVTRENFEEVLKSAGKMATEEEIAKMIEGVEFKGLIFMKFASDVGASVGINVVRDKANTSGKDSKDRIWCDLEAPIEVRVALGFLQDLRSQLIEWRFAKECVSIDRDVCAIKVNEEWADCADFQNSQELKTIKESAEDRLLKGRARTSKGPGKGSEQ